MQVFDGDGQLRVAAAGGHERPQVLAAVEDLREHLGLGRRELLVGGGYGDEVLAEVAPFFDHLREDFDFGRLLLLHLGGFDGGLRRDQ